MRIQGNRGSEIQVYRNTGIHRNRKKTGVQRYRYTEIQGYIEIEKKQGYWDTDKGYRITGSLGYRNTEIPRNTEIRVQDYRNTLIHGTDAEALNTGINVIYFVIFKF